MKYKLLLTGLAALIFIAIGFAFNHPKAADDAGSTSPDASASQPDTTQGQYSGLGK